MNVISDIKEPEMPVRNLCGNTKNQLYKLNASSRVLGQREKLGVC